MYMGISTAHSSQKDHRIVQKEKKSLYLQTAVDRNQAEKTILNCKHSLIFIEKKRMTQRVKLRDQWWSQKP